MSSKDVIEGETCMLCGEDSLTLSEETVEIPHFGETFIFSMQCGNCDFSQSDVEAAEEKEACEWSFTVSSEEDLDTRVVKSRNATIKVNYVGEVEPGEAATGEVTNVESVLQRFRQVMEGRKDEADGDERKKLQNRIDKVADALYGREEITLKIKDPTGNSAIISDAATRKDL